MARYATVNGKLAPVTKRGEPRKGVTFHRVSEGAGAVKRPRSKPRVALPRGTPIGRNDVPQIRPAPRQKKQRGTVPKVDALPGEAQGTTPEQRPAPLPAVEAAPSRSCGYCGKPIGPDKRAGTVFCSTNCKALAHYHKTHKA